jgi:predicted RNase H-like HicB family nuclease
MQHYFALFKTTDEAVEVEFPDLLGCITFGGDREEALANAEDALSTWLAYADSEYIKAPSEYSELEHLLIDDDLMLVPVSVENV